MKPRVFLLMLALAPPAFADDKPDDWVNAEKFVPNLKLDIRYATKDNFVGEVMYPSARCFLRRGAAERLKRAAEKLATRGLGLIAYDCYRPQSVQAKLWAKKPVKGYVAPPQPGSVHNRGAAIDTGLYDLKTGQPLPMPSAYDDLSKKAHHGYAGGTAEQRKNRETLKTTLTAEGFTIVKMEWWHYEDPAAKDFPVVDEAFDALDKLTAPPGRESVGGGTFRKKGGCDEPPAGTPPPSDPKKLGDCEIKL